MLVSRVQLRGVSGEIVLSTSSRDLYGGCLISERGWRRAKQRNKL